LYKKNIFYCLKKYFKNYPKIKLTTINSNNSKLNYSKNINDQKPGTRL